VIKLRRALPPTVLLMVAVLAWFAPASAAKNVGQMRESASRNGVAAAPEPDPENSEAPTNNPTPAEPEAPTNNPTPAEPDAPTSNPGPVEPEAPTNNPGPADPEETVAEPQPDSGAVDETPGAANDVGGPQDENGTTAPADDAPLEISPEVQAAADEAVANIFDEPISVTELGDAVDGLVVAADTPEEMAALVGSLLNQDLSDEQFAAVADGVFVDNLTDENFVAALDAVFAEPLSDEQFNGVLESVLDEPLSEVQFESLVNVLESESVSEDQVSSAVDAVLENDISETEAESLAQSEKVLDSIDGDQATEIFAAIDVAELTDAEGAEIVDAVQNADDDVRGAFEDELNIFEGQFDTYVPLNSKINVADRRTVVAVSVVSTTALASMGVRGAMPMGGTPSGGSGAGLAEAFKSESNRIRRISKYKLKNGRRVVDKKNFSKKLILSIMQNSFTLVGFIVVYLTLSGSVRTIAGLATLIAFFSTLYIDMRED